MRILAGDATQWCLAIGDTLQNLPVFTVVDVLFHGDAVFRQPLHPIGLVAHLVVFLAVVLHLVNAATAS